MKVARKRAVHSAAVSFDEAAVSAVQQRQPDLRGLFDPWVATDAEAWAAENGWEPRDKPDDAVSPVMQLMYARLALSERKEISSGEGQAIMSAMAHCAQGQLSIPSWLASAFVDRVDKAEGEFNSWDKAFGIPLRKKGINMKARARRFALQEPIYQAVNAAREQGMKMDEALFESVGSRFGIKKTLCAEIYYKTRQDRENFRKR